MVRNSSQAHKDMEGIYYDNIDYHSNEFCCSEQSHNALIMRPTYFHKTYYYETKIMDVKEVWIMKLMKINTINANPEGINQICVQSCNEPIE